MILLYIESGKTKYRVKKEPLLTSLVQEKDSVDCQKR